MCDALNKRPFIWQLPGSSIQQPKPSINPFNKQNSINTPLSIFLYGNLPFFNIFPGYFPSCVWRVVEIDSRTSPCPSCSRNGTFVPFWCIPSVSVAIPSSPVQSGTCACEEGRVRRSAWRCSRPLPEHPSPDVPSPCSQEMDRSGIGWFPQSIFHQVSSRYSQFLLQFLPVSIPRHCITAIPGDSQSFA